MKSREFRKFYYFARKFFYEKTHASAIAGLIDIDGNGNSFKYMNTSNLNKHTYNLVISYPNANL
jgi:hypothetical protein